MPGGAAAAKALAARRRRLKDSYSLLYQHELEKRQAEIDAQNAEKKSIEWGSQIRSYVLQPYRMVKDLRTGHESGNTDKVLGGELQPFMEVWLTRRSGTDTTT